eukprot:TRINITY_DN17673_c0_g1_i2.p1 TRINITY_DN17673_c0_g1~~TRINITY_DN17673_c0_g1_i2.p1  ORF type:complete len:225 (+),score=41.18 TRINITY_DN17673_c0_g1_i2:110-784(+)
MGINITILNHSMQPGSGIPFHVTATIRSLDIQGDVPFGCRLLLGAGPSVARSVELKVSGPMSFHVPALKAKDTFSVAVRLHGKVLAEASKPIPLSVLASESKEFLFDMELNSLSSERLIRGRCSISVVFTRMKPEEVKRETFHVDLAEDPNFVDLKLQLEQVERENGELNKEIQQIKVDRENAGRNILKEKAAMKKKDDELEADIIFLRSTLEKLKKDMEAIKF